MTFASGGFANSGFQTDQLVVGRVRPHRNYYEILGRYFLLSDAELEYLLYKIAEGSKLPKRSKKAKRIRVPKQWEPIPLRPFKFDVVNDLVVEAKNHNYPVMLDVLERMRSTEDEDLDILLLYG